MELNSRLALYEAFIGFVDQRIRGERSVSNRRVFGVLLWGLLLPTALILVHALLSRLGLLPRVLRGQADWLVLVFPLMYSLYFLGTEMIREVPVIFRRGGISIQLEQSAKEGRWREIVCHDLKVTLSAASPGDWQWMVSNFQIDLDRVRHRNRYMTVFAGAVLFMLLQGIDWLPTGSHGTDVDWLQLLVLGVVLMLLHLSGSQAHRLLYKYLDCARLIAADRSRSG